MTDELQERNDVLLMERKIPAKRQKFLAVPVITLDINTVPVMTLDINAVPVITLDLRSVPIVTRYWKTIRVFFVAN